MQGCSDLAWSFYVSCRATILTNWVYAVGSSIVLHYMGENDQKLIDNVLLHEEFLQKDFFHLTESAQLNMRGGHDTRQRIIELEEYKSGAMFIKTMANTLITGIFSGMIASKIYTHEYMKNNSYKAHLTVIICTGLGALATWLQPLHIEYKISNVFNQMASPIFGGILGGCTALSIINNMHCDDASEIQDTLLNEMQYSVIEKGIQI